VSAGTTGANTLRGLALGAACLAAIVAAPASATDAGGLVDWWLTPDQQGQRLLDRGEYVEAARRFTTPERIGDALYRSGDFEGAAAAYGRTRTAEGAYNRGNALVFLGRYDEAIESYEAALGIHPGWAEAEENLALAAARRDALAPPESDAGGTGGKLGADEIVMDDSGRVASSEQEQVIDAGDQALGEDALRALWLRRVDTRPQDFLAAKFNAQLAAPEDTP
jgi:Ca-activated chloride channel family protein